MTKYDELAALVERAKRNEVPTSSAFTSAAELLFNAGYLTGERWEDNPFVVAVSFDVHKGNIDAGRGA